MHAFFNYICHLQVHLVEWYAVVNPPKINEAELLTSFLKHSI